MKRKRGLAIAWLVAACSSPARPPEEEKGPATPTPTPTPAATATTADAAPTPAVAAANQPVVSYGGASRFGADSFVIQPDGRVRSSFIAPGTPEDVKTGQVAADQLAEMKRSFEAAGCCALVSQRSEGVPDEGHTQLQLGFPGLVCTVSLWDNEWHDLPAAAACARIIDRVRRRLRR